MKKTLFAIGAMVAMVACSNDFVVKEAAQEAIGFDNAFVDNSTRSVVDPSLTTETLKTDGFGVYGFVTNTTTNKTAANFTNEEISFNNTSGNWEYASKQNWIPGAVHDFAAVAPYNAYTNVVATRDGLNLSFTNDGETDLLYDQVNNATHNTTVAFSFRHTLSKVKFSFENAYDATNTTIKVYDIKINNAYTTANVALTDNATTWSGHDNGNLVLDFGVATDNETTPGKEDAEVAQGLGTYESQNELFLIPFNYTAENKLNVTFMYDIVLNGEPFTFGVRKDVIVNLEPGKAYDFKGTITPGEPIEFTVTKIENWVEQPVQNI